MDLGAYAQIDNLNALMARNGINVPRLRGLRLMSQEKMVSQDDIARIAHDHAMCECESLCESDFKLNSWCFELSERTRRIKRKYLIYDNLDPIDVRWSSIHGKKRKAFKYAIKRATRRTYTQYAMFNSYCGRPDILYIHARIGGGNWSHYGKEVKDQPWFICKVDDAFDSTYCDIYARLNPDISRELANGGERSDE